MAKTRQGFSRLLAISLLSAALGGCAGSSTPTTPAPASPDASQKDPTKNPSGTSSPGPSGTVGAAGGSASPLSPNLSSKDPTKAAGAPPATPPDANTPLKAPDYKDATHVLTENQPFFMSSPTSEAKPDKILAAGSPVLVLVPGAGYSQIKLGDGVEGYVSTAALKPLGK